jgi:hypothetical protein
MWHPDFEVEPCTYAPYRREPYVRATFSLDGSTLQALDGKATAWTPGHVLFHWVGEDYDHHERWLPASAFRRISRDESSWIDPYDL